MKKLLKIPLILGLLSIAISLNAQSDLSKEVLIGQDSVIFEREISGGLLAHSQGFGGVFRVSKNINTLKKRSWEFELSSVKSLKQFKTRNPYFANAKSFVFGKLNNVFFLKGGFGEHRLISRKPYWGGVEIRYFYSAGATIGITKPIYLYIVQIINQELSNPVTERYDPDEHTIDDIYGRAPFIKGLNEIKFYPGLHAKFGFSFDISPYKVQPNFVEVGVSLDAFLKGLPIMAENDPENIFLTFFLNYQIGRRYNK